MKIFNFYIVFPLLLLVGFGNLCAQSTEGQEGAEVVLEPEELAEQTLRELKGGVLIVRLPSRHRKIQELERLSQSKQLKEKKRKRMENLFHLAKAERDRDVDGIWRAFHESYDFSEVYYMYDSAYVQLKKGQLSGYFLNEQKEVDASISLEGRSYFILQFGAEVKDKYSAKGIEATIVKDRHFKALKAPFPYYVETKNLKKLYKDIFEPKEWAYYMALHAAKAFNFKFNLRYGRLDQTD